ncbi:hypothetical protein QJS10_CPA09g00793 [Acorus calamus]|uniref:Uncharacterized protein n=1 Tax=Acorus calamus TaxID=4465 RepID=A0AAV9EAX9_ACOCL|nr:hypothetical protein QJS10_CPA09g00793 [Acorus calamus]
MLMGRRCHHYENTSTGCPGCCRLQIKDSAADKFIIDLSEPHIIYVVNDMMKERLQELHREWRGA